MYVEEGKTPYLIGLDLGQSQDYSALVVLRQIGAPPSRYQLCFIRRFPLMTPYQEIVSYVSLLVKSDDFKDHPTALVVDATGVGAPVLENLKEAGLRPIAVTISGGFDVTRRAGNNFVVPKRDLVSTLRLLLDGERLRIAESLPEAKLLSEELLNFRMKISNGGRDTYEPIREGEHDDLVLATALATWFGEHQVRTSAPMKPKPLGRKKRLIGAFPD